MSYTAFGSSPISIPIFSTWGHERFNSKPKIFRFFSLLTISGNSSGFDPTMLTINGMSFCDISFEKHSRPGLAKPTAFM
jgi:hypothetical protein